MRIEIYQGDELVQVLTKTKSSDVLPTKPKHVDKKPSKIMIDEGNDNTEPDENIRDVKPRKPKIEVNVYNPRSSSEYGNGLNRTLYSKDKEEEQKPTEQVESSLEVKEITIDEFQDKYESHKCDCDGKCRDNCKCKQQKESESSEIFIDKLVVIGNEYDENEEEEIEEKTETVSFEENIYPSY